MALFLPPNVTPLAPASNFNTWSDDSILEGSLAHSDFFQKPAKGFEDRDVKLDYIQLSDSTQSYPSKYVQKILDDTPKPKGRNAFTSIHVVGPHESIRSSEAEEAIQTLCEGSKVLNKEVFVHRLDAVGCIEGATSMQEYNTIFKAASSLLMQKADRASLLVFVGWENVKMDSYAAFIGLLPFRGVQVALITRRKDYANLLSFTTPSGTFELDGLTAARMGKYSIHAVYGPLTSKRIEVAI